MKEFDGMKLKSTFAAVSPSPGLEALLKEDLEGLCTVDPVVGYSGQRF